MVLHELKNPLGGILTAIDLLLCVAKLSDGRISVSEQLLRGGRRTDRTARDNANGPEKEATGISKAPPAGRDIAHR